MVTRVIALTDDYKEAALSLIREAHGDAVADWHRALWNWKVAGNPARQDGQDYRIGLIEDDSLIGASTLMPVRVKVGETIYPAASHLDLVVSPAATEGGIVENILDICDEAIRRAPALVYGNADEQRAKIWFWALGRDGVVGRYRRYHRVLALGPIARARYPVGALVAALAGAAYGVVTAAVDAVALRRGGRRISLRPVQEFDDAFERLWRWASPSHPNLAVRDGSFLKWRLREIPNRDHTVLGAYRNGDLVGYVALRIYDDKTWRKALLVDVFTHRDALDVMRALLVGAIREARRRGAVILTMLEVLQPQLRRLIRSLLFFGVEPHSCISINSATIPTSAYVVPDGWWITLADTDFDLVSPL